MLIPQEPRLTPQSYAFLADLVHRRSRIRLGSDRQALVAGRLAQRLRTLGLSSFEDYCRILESPDGAEEIGSLIDLISTNHTQFFREPAHFDILSGQVLPQLVARRGQVWRPLRVWCAAAASGEEAYSLAISLAEFGRDHRGFSWQVHASDISSRMLDRCRLGIYEKDRVNLPDEELLRRHFQRGFGHREGCYRVRPELRRCVLVEHINLFQRPYPLPPEIDVIFCRNVMIYFDPASRQELIERLEGMLAPGGYLFVGHAESLLGMRHGLRAAWPSVYQRPQ
ncbi:MAG: protein-glutamate O-methyltransferase CheR [Planctomycetia bacterium]|nr:protein-glutamate O-methyltransferase CheR [Planctomycetia bacterium]